MNFKAWHVALTVTAGALALCWVPTGYDAVAPAATPATFGDKKPLPQSTFGGSIFRNMVNLTDKNVVTEWSVEPGKFKNVKWVADLGTISHGGVVVHGGRVFAGTNNLKPRDLKNKGEKAVVMCFAEKDGAFLWQNLHDMPPEEVLRHAVTHGHCSTPTVEGDFLYYGTPACVIVCAQVKDGKVVWQRDLMKEQKVVPCFVGACSPLVVGDMVFAMTGNGLDEDTQKVTSPQAPSFVGLRKDNGELVWKSSLPGGNIIHGQWANPVYAEPGGKPQVIFPGGDGYLYAFEPKTGNLIWKFQCSPQPTKVDRGIRPYLTATPVVHDNRLYIGVGSYPSYESPPKIGHFYCIDVTKTGDVSCKNENFDPKDAANKDSALIWHFGGLIQPPPAKGRVVKLGACCGTVAVHDGLVYLAEEPGFLHCLDAKSGQLYWSHDFRVNIYGSPYWVDGKIYLCTADGDCHIFEAGKKFQKPHNFDILEPLESTPVVSNGVLFIGASSKIYALAAK